MEHKYWPISELLENQARSIVQTDDGGYVILGYAFTGLYEPLILGYVKSIQPVTKSGSEPWMEIMFLWLKCLVEVLF